MNSPGGAATQIYAQQSDRRFFSPPRDVQARIQCRIDELGRNLRGFPHYWMQGVDAFRPRVGDYRIIYPFNAAKNELHLIAVGKRCEIYKKPFN